MIPHLFLSLPFFISASPSLSLCISLGLTLEKQGLLFQWEVGLLVGDSGFELFTVNLPGARFLGCRVVSIQAPKPLRINEAPSSASNGDKDEQGQECGLPGGGSNGDSGQAAESLGLERNVPCSGSSALNPTPQGPVSSLFGVK